MAREINDLGDRITFATLAGSGQVSREGEWRLTVIKKGRSA